MTLHAHDAPYRFCPLCGGRLAPRVVKPGEPARPACGGCGHIVYLDPKVAVGAVIRNAGGEIALVRRAIEPGYGKWVFPGGYVDRGEEPRAAAVREAREEANLRIRIDGLLGLYSYPGATTLIIVYTAAVSGGALRAEDESLEAAWFGAGNIPWPALAFRSTGDALRDYFRTTPAATPSQAAEPAAGRHPPPRAES